MQNVWVSTSRSSGDARNASSIARLKSTSNPRLHALQRACSSIFASDSTTDDGIRHDGQITSHTIDSAPSFAARRHASIIASSGTANFPASSSGRIRATS